MAFPYKKTQLYRSKSEFDIRTVSNNFKCNPTHNMIYPNKTNKKNNIKRADKIKNLFKEILLTPSSKAIIKFLFTDNLTLKLILFVVVLGLAGCSSYLSIQSIINYYSYDVSTMSRTYHEMTSLFPKVTFCNVNPFTTEYGYNLSQMGISYTDPNLSIEERKMLGHNLNEILFDCSFNSNQCLSNDFIWSWDEAFGNCYTFNSGFDSNGNKIDLKDSSIEGPEFGLQLTIYVNVYEKLLSIYEADAVNGFGGIIRIGNSSYSTYYSSGDGILVSAGSFTNIMVEREFKSILPQPYSNCEIDSNTPRFIPNMDFYNLILKSNYEYTQKFCFLQCYQNYIIQKYNCSYLSYPSLFNASQCSWDLSTIIWLVNEDIFNSTFINKYCISSCPLECDQTLYTNSISSNLLNGYNYIGLIQSTPNLSKDFINRTIDANNARESIVKINVYYDSLSYSLTKESPQIDAVSLMGSIGGNLGLFLGVSMFSLCEILEVIVEIFFILKMRDKNN